VRVVRSLIGIFIGFGIFLAAIGALSGNGLLFSVAGTVAAAVVSGYVTALIAGAHEFPHVAAVGMLMIGTGFVSMLQEGATRPGWHQITIGGCGPISAMIGAAIRLLSKTRQIENSNTSARAIRR
jgi:hypothetical protein